MLTKSLHSCGLLTAALLTSLSTLSSRGDTPVVVDRTDRKPIVGASVVSRQGLIMGISDKNGRLPSFTKTDLPLTVRSVGFREANLYDGVDTLLMDEEPYVLPEFTVTYGERPVIKIVAYVREYCTGAMAGDTLQFYSEYMMRSFVTGKEKAKGYHDSDAKPKVLNSRRYCRYLNEKRDSVAVPTGMEDVLSWCNAVDFKGIVEEPETIRGGASADTVQGKYSPMLFFEKDARTFSRRKDLLGDHKGHTYSPAIFKLLGFTVDADRLQFREVYAADESGIYGPDDLISKVYNIHMRGRGKLWKFLFRTKELVDMDSFIEVYPVEISYLTVPEYKEERKEKDPIPFRTNENVPKLLPSIQKIVDRVNSLHQ